jgi:hypothetical protein
MKILATLYAVLVTLAACLAWWVDITLQYSSKEHLLPDVLLFGMTLPSSMLLPFLFDAFPLVFDLPFAPLVALSITGFLQATLLVVLAFRKSYRR